MAFGDVIARLSVVLGLDTAAFEKGATLAEKQMAQTRRKLESIGGKMSDIGTKMSIGLTAPLAAFGVSAFDAASDAAELQSAFNQTFGSMSGVMTRWAEETGDAMGRSTQEMQKAANTFGIFFNTAVDTQKAAEMSQVFAKLAQDLGSFYNVDTETAIAKLRSGLTGESEPMRDFGVFLSEAAVKAKAAEMGLSGLGDELTEQEKILARYQLIMEGTANAQGDVARTASGTANQMRAAKAAFEELQVVVGTKLLPVITPLIEKLAAAMNWFSRLPEPVQTTAIGVAAVSAAVGPLLMGIGALLPLFVKLVPLLTALGPVLTAIKVGMLAIAANPIILGLTALVGGIYLAWKNWDTIEPILRRLYNGVKNWIGDKLTAALNAVLAPIKAVERGFAWLYDRVVGNSWVPDMVAGIADEFGTLDHVMGDQAEAVAVRVERTMKEMADATLNALSSLTNSIKSGGFLDILQGVIGFGLQLGSVGAFGKGVAGRLNGTGSPAMAPRAPAMVDVPRSPVSPSGGFTSASASTVQVVPSPYFDVVVDGRIVSAAPGLMQGGAQMAQSQLAFRQSRRLA